MKSTVKLHQLFIALFSILITFSIYSCSEEQVSPVLSQDLQISSRTDGSQVNIQSVKQKVADRDHIPVSQILTCTYCCQTQQGYWEYHLTTQYNGPKIYTVISVNIIGDINDGF